jgi:hypothetical protein
LLFRDQVSVKISEIQIRHGIVVALPGVLARMRLLETLI